MLTGGGMFTCVTCRVQFDVGDQQRLHYKSEWHRYNLKRKVVSLPSITLKAFVEKTDQLIKESKAETTSSTASRCAVCSKTFASDNSLRSHLESKKHKEAAAKRGADEAVVIVAKKSESSVEAKRRRGPGPKERVAAIKAAKEEMEEEEDEDEEGWESLDEDEGEEADAEEGLDGDNDGLLWGGGKPLSNLTCLFCCKKFKSVEDNLVHMSTTHSFFIPDLEYLVDPAGLLTYLGEKVGCGFLCLWCNEKGKAFQSVEAAQKHMQDKGHTKMLHEGDAFLEYSDYYDYRPSYPDYNPEKTVDTDMEVECGTTEDSCSEDDLSIEELDGDGYQLVLPSGATVGHRSLQRYYRQSLNPRFHNAVVSKQRTAVQKLLSHYRALGWTGSTGEAAKVKAKDETFARNAFQKSHMRLGVKANKLQKHFREQVIF